MCDVVLRCCRLFVKILGMRLAAKERDVNLSADHADAAESSVAKCHLQLRYSSNAILEIMNLQLQQKRADKLREAAAVPGQSVNNVEHLGSRPCWF